nr:MAG TPA: ATP synthase subunit 9 [Bacteriophage sp.]DAV77911.1 MAG TPA: ATP synthase subunit 9 [Bacteriophage sp.]
MTMKKITFSDVALVIAILTLLFQIFCHFILPRF